MRIIDDKHDEKSFLDKLFLKFLRRDKNEIFLIL